ncbi:MAG: hypothetical protein K2X66_07845 [Cyanobacteria bacterium]|nr:hypothetical protein [Cyanobacteriota bacterium]
MSNHSNSDRQDLHRVYDTGYQTKKHYLENQLKCSEAVQDFKSVKNLLSGSSYFNVRRVFKFALEPIPVTVQESRNQR